MSQDNETFLTNTSKIRDQLLKKYLSAINAHVTAIKMCLKVNLHKINQIRLGNV